MALVLTQKLGETTRIGGDIYVTVARLRGDGVRIMYSADPSLKIKRHDLLVADNELPDALKKIDESSQRSPRRSRSKKSK